MCIGLAPAAAEEPDWFTKRMKQKNETNLKSSKTLKDSKEKGYHTSI
jgi:hypothetical protein